MAVFENIVYSARLLDPARDDRITLVVDAILRDGDADGPLLMPLPEVAVLIGIDNAHRLFPKYRDGGRVVDHMGVAHLSFPFWELARA